MKVDEKVARSTALSAMMTTMTPMLAMATQREVALRSAHAAISYCCPPFVSVWRRDDTGIN